MNLLKTVLIAIALAATFNAMARQATDTLYTSSGDRLIISYNVVNNDGKVEIRFTNLKKRLCSANKEKYDDLAEISVMCFDRNSFNDVTFKGLPPTTFSIPSGFKYTPSDDGFLNLEEQPVLVFEGAPDNVFRLIIPMYLVHYERKRHYKILAQCDNLKITEEPKHAQQLAPVVTQPESSLDILIAEGPGITEEEIAALTSIRYIEEELSTNTKLPFSNELLEKVEELKQLKLTLKDKETVARIETVLDAFESKRIVLEFQALEEEKRVKDSADYAQCNTIEAYEAYIKDHPDGAYVDEAQMEKAQLEDQAEAQASEEKKNLRTWLIVGGILLVDLVIAGILVARHVRKKDRDTESEDPHPKKRKRKKDNDFVATI